MRKILLASTALVVSAGFASADVSLSGSAELGIVGSSASETRFESNVDIRFTLSNTTDSGLTFGATIDLDEATTTQNSSGAVFVSGGFGTITLGDTDGAFDRALNEVGSGSALKDDHTNHAGYNGNGGLDGGHNGKVLRWDYSLGNFGVSVSSELNDGVTVPNPMGGNAEADPVEPPTNQSDIDTANALNDSENIHSIGATYSMDVGGGSVGFGLGYQTGKEQHRAGLSISGTFGGGFSGVLNYTTGNGEFSSAGVGVAYQLDAVLLHANYGENTNEDGVKTTGWGVAANYALGGGATAQFGYGKGDGSSTWSLGLGLNF